MKKKVVQVFQNKYMFKFQVLNNLKVGSSDLLKKEVHGKNVGSSDLLKKEVYGTNIRSSDQLHKEV